MSPPLRGGDLAKEGKIMKNVSTLTIGFSIIVFTLLSATIDIANSDSVGTLRRTDDISRSKAAFAVVGEEIARGLNLHTLSESDYWKLRGPVLLDPQTEIHFHLREQFGSIVNTVDFGASMAAGSPSQNSPISRGNKPVLYKNASEIIRDFIAQKNISVIIVSHAPIGRGEIAAIRGLQGEVRYTYEIINSACVAIPIKNIVGLIRQPFITEMWPDAKGYLLNGNGAVAVQKNLLQIGADKVHKQPPNGLGVTGKGVIVGVVDDGIYDNHTEFLDGNTSRIKDNRGATNLLEGSAIHGTFVAGIIGAADNGNNVTGVAPGVGFIDASYTLFFRRILDNIFTWDEIAGAYGDAIEAIEWAAAPRQLNSPDADVKADVVNLSSGWDPWRYGRKGDDPMSTLIDKLVGLHEVVVITSAGNEIGRRASDKIMATGKTKKHTFTPNDSRVVVTLLWDDDSNDLDLAIIKKKDKEICSSRNRGGGLLGFFPNNKVWEGKTDYGQFYEQVACDVEPNTEYSVQVEGHNVSSLQEYEVWLEVEGVDPPQFTQFNQNNKRTLTVPGYSRNIITVGATVGAVDGDDKIAKFSGHGPSDTNLIKPEVVAPGVEIRSTGRYGELTHSGTSAAAPHVAGVAALILDAVGKNKDGKWNFSPAEVKSAIVRGAEYIPGNIPDSTYGAGLVKADNIIFGGTVNPGKKLCFKITPRLTKHKYNTYFLNAENVFSQEPFVVPSTVPLAMAISWEEKSRDLDLEILDQKGNPIVLPPTSPNQGSNYEKISVLLSTAFNFGDFFYLNVIHNDQVNEPIHFTGASTHPIRHVKLDVNDDGFVDLKDLVEVAKKFKEVGVHIEDINCDGVVDLDDMKIIAEKIAGAPAAPTASQVAIETIQQWLVEAKQMGNTDPDFLRGIAMLEQLLALLTPMETALLPNYPNPFNPETWIPYQLADPCGC